MAVRPLTQKEADELVKDVNSFKEFDEIIWDIEKDLWLERPVDIWTFL